MNLDKLIRDLEKQVSDTPFEPEDFSAWLQGDLTVTVLMHCNRIVLERYESLSTSETAEQIALKVAEIKKRCALIPSWTGQTANGTCRYGYNVLAVEYDKVVELTKRPKPAEVIASVIEVKIVFADGRAEVGLQVRNTILIELKLILAELFDE